MIDCHPPHHHHPHHVHHDHAPGGNGAGTGCKTKASTKQHIRQDLSDSILGPEKIKNMIMMMCIEDMSIIEHHHDEARYQMKNMFMIAIGSDPP